MPVGGADGLVRLWDVRSGECVGTFDEHADRVWALAVAREEEGEEGVQGGEAASSLLPEKAYFFSGGSDSRLLLWRDDTLQQEQERVQEQELTILAEQQLAVDLRKGNYGKVRRGGEGGICFVGLACTFTPPLALFIAKEVLLGAKLILPITIARKGSSLFYFLFDGGGGLRRLVGYTNYSFVR